MLSITVQSSASLTASDLPSLATGAGFFVLAVAGTFWLRVARSPVARRADALTYAAGTTGVGFIALALGWFLPGLT